MKISFVHDWEPDVEQELTWKDGLAAALKELVRRGHDIQFLTVGPEVELPHPYFKIAMSQNVVSRVKEFNPDVILHWADCTRPNARPLHELGVPMALCFAGGNPAGETYPFFKHIFVESQVYLDEFKKLDVPTSIAFGTNTELFKPLPEQPKLFDTIFPGTFASWKRHGLYAEAVEGLRSLACGYIYHDHETECWQECQRRGVAILPHVSADVLRYLYASSLCCVVASNSAGGSQRTVLEAMAMNLPLVITDSDKFDYVRPSGICLEAQPNAESLRQTISLAMHSQVETRQYVLDSWSEHTYADSLEQELQKLCA